MKLDRDEIDRALAEWQVRVQRVKSNLQLLEDSGTYTQIHQGLTLTGRSRSEVWEPVHAAGELADYCVILEGQVARAAELRSSLRAWSSAEDILREIDRLLNGASVPIAPPKVPLAQRNLLDDPGQSQITLAQLVDLMTEAFAAARDAITRYDSAQRTLRPSLSAADIQLAGLDARARDLGVAAQSRLVVIRACVDAARRQALDDPLGAADTFQQQAADQLQGLDQELAALAADRDVAVASLARARLRQQRAVRRMDPSVTSGLGEWLASIGATVDSGRQGAARVGLERWSAAASAAYAAFEACDEQLDLLKALRAKAQALRSRGQVVPPEVDALALQAEALLRSDPPNPASAEPFLRQYQRALSTHNTP